MNSGYVMGNITFGKSKPNKLYSGVKIRPIEATEEMILCWFRYSLGRRTAMVSLCVDWLIANWPRLQPLLRERITKELNEAFERDDKTRNKKGEKYHALGDRCDREDWERLYCIANNIITDGFGNFWGAKCPECGGKMEIVRPGKVQCGRCG